MLGRISSFSWACEELHSGAGSYTCLMSIHNAAPGRSLRLETAGVRGRLTPSKAADGRVHRKDGSPSRSRGNQLQGLGLFEGMKVVITR